MTMSEKHNRSSGFTLIEILIVMAIVALLGAFAIPSYQEYSRQARRTDAQNTLLTLSNNLEKYYSNNNTYTMDGTDMGYPATPIISPEGWYSVSIAAGVTGSITTSYAATATPVPGQPQAADSDCATLSFDSTGAKGSTGGGECWQ